MSSVSPTNSDDCSNLTEMKTEAQRENFPKDSQRIRMRDRIRTLILTQTTYLVADAPSHLPVHSRGKASWPQAWGQPQSHDNTITATPGRRGLAQAM